MAGGSERQTGACVIQPTDGPDADFASRRSQPRAGRVRHHAGPAVGQWDLGGCLRNSCGAGIRISPTQVATRQGRQCELSIRTTPHRCVTTVTVTCAASTCCFLPGQHRLATMVWVRKGGVLALAVAMLAGQAVACVAPAAIAAENCCRPHPMTHCGAMQAPDAKSCCTAPANPERGFLTVRATTPQSQPAAAAHVFQPLTDGIGSQAARLRGSCELPPESPPGSISILRI